MIVKLRTWDQRFNDPAFTGDIAKPNPAFVDKETAIRLRGERLLRYAEPPDPRDGDGKKTVILHGRRVSELSPKLRWPHAELWGVTRCNVVYWRETLTDWDRWFDLHPVEPTPFHRGIKAKRPEAWDWYARQPKGKPIYLLEPHYDVPASVAFPREAVQDYHQSKRFTCSVDWLIGLAMAWGFRRIVLNGIGARFQDDFQFAHRGILYWLGKAEGAGIELVIEGPSCYAMPTEVYGYEVGAPAYAEVPEPAIVA